MLLAHKLSKKLWIMTILFILWKFWSARVFFDDRKKWLKSFLCWNELLVELFAEIIFWMRENKSEKS
jgi:hypothetical protein